MPLGGAREVLLSTEASPGLRAGWGELVPLGSDGRATWTTLATRPAREPSLAYLHAGDLRARPQLLGGWYAIEDGGWRWMGKEAHAVLQTPEESLIDFDLRLFFPENHMERADGPVTVSLLLQDSLFAQQTYSRPGPYTIRKPVPAGSLPQRATRVALRLNRVVPPTDGDQRELGAVIMGFGFVK